MPEKENGHNLAGSGREHSTGATVGIGHVAAVRLWLVKLMISSG